MKLLHNFWLAKLERSGSIKVYPSKIYGFETFLKPHRANKSVFIIAVGNIKFPTRVETHLDEFVVCASVNQPYRILYLTLNCASDGRVWN